MILKVGRAAIAHDVLVFIRPVSILFAQLIVPYPVSCPEPSSGQNVPLSHWSVGFMFGHLCEKGDGTMICAIPGVGWG